MTRCFELLFFGSVFLASVFVQPCIGQVGNKKKSDDPVIVGKVVDEQGKPVSDVAIYLTIDDFVNGVVGGKRTLSVMTKSKRDGSYAFTKQQYHQHGTGRSVGGLVAIAKDGRIGFHRNYYDESGVAKIALTLVPVGKYRGRLVDMAGKPIVGAKLTALMLSNNLVREEYSSKTHAVNLPDVVRSRYQAVTDKAGWFEFDKLPMTGKISLVLDAAAGYGSTRISVDLDHAVTVKLARAGKISGRLKVDRGEFKGPSHGKIYVNAYGGILAKDYRVSLYKSIKIGDDGQYSTGDVPPMKYILRPSFEAQSAFCDGQVTNVTVQPGKHHDNVSIPVTRGFTLTGSFVDEETGKPIPGIKLQFSRIVGYSRTGPFRFVTTDQDGNFSVSMPAGEVYISQQSIPKKWLGWPTWMPDNKQARVKLEADKKLEPFKLTRATKLDIVVVDADDKRVPNALVHVIQQDRHGLPFPNPWIPTNQLGELTLTQLDPVGVIAIRVRKDDLCCDGATIINVRDHKDDSEPLEFKISPKFGFRFTGNIIDSKGKLVPNTKLSVEWYRDTYNRIGRVSGRRGSKVEIGQPKADGSFRSRSLFPGDYYRLLVEADGYSKYESKQVQAKSGDNIKLGEIKLFGTTATIRGKIVVTGDQSRFKRARVFSFGEDGNHLNAKTDGLNFELQNLPDRETWVFVDADGFRFTGKFTPVNIDDLKIRIVPEDSKLTVGMTRPGSFRERCDISQEIIKALQPVLKKLDDAAIPVVSARRVINRSVAKAIPILDWDDDRKKTFFEQNGFTGEAIRIAALELEWNENTIKFIRDLLANTRPGRVDRSFIFLAHYFESRDTEIAKFFANLAIDYADPASEITKIRSTLPASNLLIRLGEKDQGTKKIKAAWKEFEKLKKVDSHSKAMIGAGIALVYPEKGWQLIQQVPLTQNQKRYVAKMAVNLAQHDLDRALELIEKLDRRSTEMNNAKMKLAYFVGLKNPQKALEIVEGINDGHGSFKVKTDALGWLAIASDQRDPDLAHKLISRRADNYFRNGSEFRSWINYGGRSVMAAHNAIQAKAIKHPNLHSIVMQTLACMPTRMEYWNQQSLIETKVKMAYFLASVDPVNTRRLLHTVDLDLQRVGGIELAKDVEVMRIRALVVADPEAAKELALKEIRRFMKMKQPDIQGSTVIEILDALTTHPSEWPTITDKSRFSIWHPGRE